MQLLGIEMNRRLRATSVGSVVAALCSGCTTLEVSRLETTSMAEEREGIAYYLPLKQLVIDASFEITQCRDGGSAPGLLYAVSAKVSEKQVPDLSQRYIVSYKSLSALTKTTDLTISTSEEGLLVSVNASAADQTGPILSSLASTAFSVARGLALGQLPSMDAASGNTPPNHCNEFQPRIAAVEKARAALKSAVVKDEERQVAAGARTKAAAALKVAESKLKEAEEAKEPIAIADARVEVRKTRAAFEVSQQTLAGLGPLETGTKTNELAEARQALSVTRTLLWTPDPTEFEAEKPAPLRISPSAQALQALGFSQEAAKFAKDAMHSEVALTPPLGVLGKDNGRDPLKKGGIVYRQPAHVLLRVCPSACEELQNGAVLEENLAYVGVHALPQLGARASLPLSNWVFEDNSLNVSFGESGQPKVVSFKSKSSAERAASSAKEIGDGYLAFVKGRETDRLDFLKGRRTDEEAQLSLESKRRDSQLDVLSDRLDTLKKLEAQEAQRSGVATRNQLTEDALEARKRQLLLLVQIKEQENKLKALNTTPE
ncbi:hypothetical protein ACG02S_19725 [Roseateles sp. DC23W]|uniref:Uncharacterized protein n=1 Tax=Pelomonas dachongensis TaxID=3299029 RepID=A0ABW7ERK9_9BURK